jgi:hypothetical protein
VSVFEKFGEMGQKEFLSLAEEEWRAFLDALAREREDDGLCFLRFHGLYAEIDLEEYCDLAREAAGRCDLLRATVALAELAGLEVVAALEYPLPGCEGEIRTYPDGEARKLLDAYWESGTYYALLLRLLAEYGPCVVLDSSDMNNGECFVAARPARGGVRGR